MVGSEQQDKKNLDDASSKGGWILAAVAVIAAGIAVAIAFVLRKNSTRRAVATDAHGGAHATTDPLNASKQVITTAHEVLETATAALNASNKAILTAKKATATANENNKVFDSASKNATHAETTAHNAAQTSMGAKKTASFAATNTTSELAKADAAKNQTNTAATKASGAKDMAVNAEQIANKAIDDAKTASSTEMAIIKGKVEKAKNDTITAQTDVAAALISATQSRDAVYTAVRKIESSKAKADNTKPQANKAMDDAKSAFHTIQNAVRDVNEAVIVAKKTEDSAVKAEQVLKIAVDDKDRVVTMAIKAENAAKEEQRTADTKLVASLANAVAATKKATAAAKAAAKSTRDAKKAASTAVVQVKNAVTRGTNAAEFVKAANVSISKYKTVAMDNLISTTTSIDVTAENVKNARLAKSTADQNEEQVQSAKRSIAFAVEHTANSVKRAMAILSAPTIPPNGMKFIVNYSGNWDARIPLAPLFNAKLNLFHHPNWSSAGHAYLVEIQIDSRSVVMYKLHTTKAGSTANTVKLSNNEIETGKFNINTNSAMGRNGYVASLEVFNKEGSSNTYHITFFGNTGQSDIIDPGNVWD